MQYLPAAELLSPHGTKTTFAAWTGQERSRTRLKDFPTSLAIADGINWGYRCAC